MIGRSGSRSAAPRRRRVNCPPEISGERQPQEGRRAEGVPPRQGRVTLPPSLRVGAARSPRRPPEAGSPPRLLAREQADQWPGSSNTCTCPQTPQRREAAPRSGRRHELARKFMPKEDPPPFASILLAPEKQAMPTIIGRTGVGCEEENWRMELYDLFTCAEPYIRYPLFIGKHGHKLPQ